MATNDKHDATGRPRIVVQKDGPYVVRGDVPLVRKDQIVSEYGEPLVWQMGDAIETEGEYQLCRCGHSHDKPFCDDAHERAGFDGAETADTRDTADRQATKKGAKIVVRRDPHLCMRSGFCMNRVTSVNEMVSHTDDTQVRSHVMAMIDRCPSGSFTYSLEEGSPDVEPDLPRQVAVTTEGTSDGKIAGPLWVTGNIPVERDDGEHFETRNRVTLCRCGRSRRKPLCDGSHRDLGIKEE